MKELENHLQLVCQMIDDENSNFQSLLQRVRKESECLNHFFYGLLKKDEGMGREEEKGSWTR